MTNTSNDVIPTKPKRTIFQKDNTQKGMIEETRFSIDYIDADILKYDMIMRMLINSNDSRGVDHVPSLKNTIDSLRALKLILEDNLKKMGGR